MIASPSDTAVPDRRLPGLDLVRLLAILLLVGGHQAVGWPESPARDLLQRPIYYSVVLLFLVSGLGVTYSLIREHDETGEISLTRFYARKLIRVWPMLAMFAAVTTVHHLVRGIDVPATRVVALVGFAGNYYNGLAAGDDSRHIVGHLWSVAVGAQFFLLWPLVLRASLRTRNERVPILLLIGITAITALVRVRYAASHVVTDVYAYNATEARWDALAVGALLAFPLAAVRRFAPALPPIGRDLLSGAASLLLGAALLVSVLGWVELGLLAETVMTAALLGIAGAGQVGATRPHPWARALAILSSFTYPLFVWHLYLITAARHVVPAGMPAAELAVLVLILLGGVAWFYGFQRPFDLIASRFRRKMN